MCATVRVRSRPSPTTQACPGCFRTPGGRKPRDDRAAHLRRRCSLDRRTGVREGRSQPAAAPQAASRRISGDECRMRRVSRRSCATVKSSGRPVTRAAGNGAAGGANSWPPHRPGQSPVAHPSGVIRHLSSKPRLRVCRCLTQSVGNGNALSVSAASKAVATAGGAPIVRPQVGNSLTVEQRSLTPSVLVRIQVPQPARILSKSVTYIISGSGAGRRFGAWFGESNSARRASSLRMAFSASSVSVAA